MPSKEEAAASASVEKPKPKESPAVVSASPSPAPPKFDKSKSTLPPSLKNYDKEIKSVRRALVSSITPKV
jgi:hypothetical protein